MHPTPCSDCGVDVFESGEYCMLHFSVWREAVEAGSPAQNLCVGCIETRLGRRLTANDFDMHYQQNTKPGKSARLLDRLGRN